MAAAIALRTRTDGEVEASDSELAVDERNRDHPDPLDRHGYDGPFTTPTRTAEECWLAADQTVLAALDREYDELVADHQRDHRRLFRRSSLELAGSAISGLPTDVRVARARDVEDPALAALIFNYGRYLMIASSRPGGLPTNLQGIWNDILRPPWSSNYTVNINTEMNYWPAETTNLSECHEPLLRYHRSPRPGGPPVRRVSATAAAAGPRTTTPTRGAGRSRSRAIRGGRTGRWRVRGWPGICGTTTQFTGDLEFLGGSWPMLRGAAEFCLDWLVELPDGSSRYGAVDVSGERLHRRRRASRHRSPSRRPWTWR